VPFGTMEGKVMTKQALLRALTVLCGLLVLQGCKSDTAKDAKIEPVLVLEYGTLPRRLLRYAIEEGSTATSTMELSTSSMTTTSSAGEEFTSRPGLRFVVSSGPAIKLPSGNARFDIQITKAEAILPPGVDPEVERDFNTSAALLEEVGGWIEVNDRGIVQRSELNQALKNPNVPTRLLMTIAQARTSLARVLLPAEPVGLGARWEARKLLEVYGFEIQQRDRYTIMDIVGDKLKLKIDISQTAPKQTLAFEEEGVEFVLKSLSVSARGDVTLNLNALEGSSLVEGESAEVLTVKAAGSTEKIKLDSAFQLKTEVTYEIFERNAEGIEEAATKTSPGPKY
jgi:hypothetical protein